MLGHNTEEFFSEDGLEMAIEVSWDTELYVSIGTLVRWS